MKLYAHVNGEVFELTAQCVEHLRPYRLMMLLVFVNLIGLHLEQKTDPFHLFCSPKV